MRKLASEFADQLTKNAIDHCEEIAEVSELERGVLRPYLTDKHKEGNELTASWMQEVGMTTWQDAAGNQWGRLASKNPNAKRLIMGSHLDTVPNAGKYDGIIGVMIAIELVRAVKNEGIELPFHFDIVGFGDEEGTRFATALIGSHALAGNFQNEWLSLRDKLGISMEEAMREFGLDPEKINDAKLNVDELIEYWEVHIEQGPVLESLQEPIGVVTGIAGAKRAAISIAGLAGHAGTTPMNLRADALTAAAELVLAIETLALECEHAEVATVGRLETRPGATNVIAGNVEMSLDVRALDDDHRDALIEKIIAQAARITEQREVRINIVWKHSAPAVKCADSIQQLFYEAATANGYKAPSLPSGAGHDGMAIAPLCDVGMLFILSPRGLSHHPEEAVVHNDVKASVETLFTALCKKAEIV